MDKLKKGAYIFPKILDYRIKEPLRREVCTKIMGNGREAINYGLMPKTIINVTIGRLNQDELSTLLTNLDVGDYTYWSKRSKDFLTNTFKVSNVPDPSDLVTVSQMDILHKSFTFTLTQIDEVAT